MVVGYGMISVKLVFRRVGIHLSGIQILLIQESCHSLLFAASVVEKSDFVQGLILEG